MPVYKVIEVGSGGSGGGCLFTAFLLAVGLFALADACDSSGPQTSGSTTVEKKPTSPSPGRAGGQSEAESIPGPDRPASDPPSPNTSGQGTSASPDDNQSQRTSRSRYVNDWVLDRLQSEKRPIAVIAMPGSKPFEDRLAEALRRRGANVQVGLLKRAAFETDVIFQRLAGGDRGMLRRLGLTKLSGYLVLCRLEFSRIQETRDGFTTRAFLSIILVPMEGGQPVRREFEAPGGEFTPDAAEKQALRRVRNDFLGSSLTDRLTRH